MFVDPPKAKAAAEVPANPFAKNPVVRAPPDVQDDPPHSSVDVVGFPAGKKPPHFKAAV